jgi:CCT motif
VLCVQLGDIDPSWLDRLDVGMDRLPSDILDSLVPEDPPLKRQASHQLQQPTRQRATAPAPSPQPAPVPASRQVHEMIYMPAPHMVAYPQYAQHAPIKLDACEQPLDIDNYIPQSLRPMDPATRAAMLHSRHEKLQRFREKKRNRHFKKTIRYASRKAYAEVRPRIKGRFARKDEVAAMRANGELPAN